MPARWAHHRIHTIARPDARREFRDDARLPESEAGEREMAGALATLRRSRSLADAISTHGSSPNPLYWFARLYYHITRHEISARHTFAYPGFILHFIPIFFDMYAENVERFSRGEAEDIAQPWQSHFSIGSLMVDPSRICAYCKAASRSVSSGVSTHIQADMPLALETAYRGYRTRYYDAGPFDRYYDDFFERNRPIFAKVRSVLIHELVDRILRHHDIRVDLSVASRMADFAGVGLSINEIYGWRKESWNTTRSNLDRSGWESHG